MRLQCCLGGATLKTLRLAAIPSSSSSSSRFFFRSLSKVFALHFHDCHSQARNPQFPLPINAFSAHALQADTPTSITTKATDEKGIHISRFFFWYG